MVSIPFISQLHLCHLSAGQVGESGGGFQRSMGEAQGMYLASPWRLHVRDSRDCCQSLGSRAVWVRR